MKILYELYYGNIDPCTRRGQPNSPLGKMRALLIRNEDIIRRRAKRSGSEPREMFTNGFCLAVRIMAEVMSTMEIPSVDD